MVECPACRESGLSKSGGACRRCNGNGEVSVVILHCGKCERFQHHYLGRAPSRCADCGRRLVRTDKWRRL